MAITISQYLLQNWQFLNPAVEMRVYANQYFVSLDGEVFQPASPASADGGYYQAITCTPDLGAHTLLIPEFVLEPTTNAQPNNCTYNFAFFSGPAPNGQVIVSFEGLTNVVVGTSPLVTNLPALVNINGQPAQSNLFSYYWVFFQIVASFYAGVAFPDGDTTPSVFNHQTFYTANTAPTDITDFLSGYNQDIIAVFIGDDNTSIFGLSRANGSFLLFGHGVNGVWKEITSGPLGIESINGNHSLAQLIVGDGTAGPSVVSAGGTTTIANSVADATHYGVLSTIAQIIAGVKTFVANMVISLGAGVSTQPIVINNANTGASDVVNNASSSISRAAFIASNDVSDTASMSILGSGQAGNAYTDGPPKANLAQFNSVGPNISINQSAGDGTIYFATQNTFRAKINSLGWTLAKGLGLNLQGATSGSVRHKAQDVAGVYEFQWPNSDPVVGENLSIAGFSSPVITLGYQPNGGSSGAEPLGIAAMLIGVSTPNQQVLLYSCNSLFTLSLTGSTGIAKVAATAQTDFLIKVNGTTKGTLRFAASGTVASLVTPISTLVGPGDVIEIIGPASPDATLATMGFNLAGNVTVPVATPVSLATMAIGLTTPSEEILIFVANSSFTLSVTGSTGIAKIAATAQTDFLIKVNGATKGTFRFAASGTVASVVTPVSTSIVSGDLIEIIGPATPDLTLANIGFNLKGTT